MATPVGSLFVELKLASVKFLRGMRAAQSMVNKFGATALSVARRVTNLGSALTALAAGGGMVYLIRQQMKEIDLLGKTASKLGITTDKLGELHHAAERAGVEIRTFNMGFQRLIRRVSEAAKDTGEAKAALKELGLEARQLAAMGPAEAFRAIADAMAAVSRQGDRVRLSMKLFDSEGVALVNMLGAGSKGLVDMAADARRLGRVLDPDMVAGVEAAGDALADLRMSFRGFAANAVTELAPLIKVIADDLTDGINDAREAAKSLNGEVGNIGKGAGKMADIAHKSVSAWKTVKTLLTADPFRWNMAKPGPDPWAAMGDRWTTADLSVRAADLRRSMAASRKHAELLRKKEEEAANAAKPKGSSFLAWAAGGTGKAATDARKAWARDKAEYRNRVAEVAEARSVESLKAAKKLQDELDRTAESLKKNLRTPLEVFKDSMRDLSALSLAPETMKRAMAQYRKDFLSATTTGPALQPANAIVKGSAADVAASAQQWARAHDPQIREQKRQTRLLEQIERNQRREREGVVAVEIPPGGGP